LGSIISLSIANALKQKKERLYRMLCKEMLFEALVLSGVAQLALQGKK